MSPGRGSPGTLNQTNMDKMLGRFTPLRVLELFAGSRSFGKVCDQNGIPVFSCDLEPYEGIDHVGDFRDMVFSDLPWVPTLIVAGVPCTSYSIAGIRYHRIEGRAISEAAHIGDQLVRKTLEWVDHFGCDYMIENPVGLLRHQPFMRDRPRRTIWYCRYGDHRAKPTDLWSNMFRDLTRPDGWEPRPQCYNGNQHCHHDKQARSYAKRKALGQHQGGTQGARDPYTRSIYPPAFVKSVIDHAQFKPR